MSACIEDVRLLARAQRRLHGHIYKVVYTSRSKWLTSLPSQTFPRLCTFEWYLSLFALATRLE